MILVHLVHAQAGQTLGIPVVDKFPAIEAAQPVDGAHPQKSLAVLENAQDIRIAQPVVDRIFLHIKMLRINRAGNKAGEEKQQQAVLCAGSCQALTLKEVQEAGLIAPCNFNFPAIAHDGGSTFAAPVHFYMLQVDKKRFVHPEKMQAGQHFLVQFKRMARCELLPVDKMDFRYKLLCPWQ